MLAPKSDIITWDDFFMGVCKLAAERSRDPSTAVGCCIVDDFNNIVGVGFNGLPRGCDPNLFPWDREGGFLDTKYAYISHSETNALDNADRSKVRGSRLYVSLFPCNECSKRIIQNGIKEVIFLSDKYHNTDAAEASRRLLVAAGIKTRQFVCNRHQVILDLEH